MHSVYSCKIQVSQTIRDKNSLLYYIVYQWITISPDFQTKSFSILGDIGL